MTTLTWLGLASLALVILFTWVAYHTTDTGTGQTRREAIIEVWISMVIGFSINWILNWFLLPLVGAKFTAVDNLALGAIYTLASVLRGFAVRRWADKHIRQFSTGLARRLS